MTTRLQEALWGRDTKLLAHELVKNPGCVNLVLDDESCETPLHYAIITEQWESVKLLLDAGANVNMKLNDRETPLILLFSILSPEPPLALVKLLIDAGADANLGVHDDSDTVLMLAARNCHKETIQLLLDANADVNVKGYNGWSALHYAVRSKCLDNVLALLYAGMKPDVRTDNDELPVDLAREDGSSDIESLLKRPIREKL